MMVVEVVVKFQGVSTMEVEVNSQVVLLLVEGVSSLVV